MVEQLSWFGTEKLNELKSLDHKIILSNKVPIIIVINVPT